MDSGSDKFSLIFILRSYKLLTYQVRLYFVMFISLSENLSKKGMIFISVLDELISEIFIPLV